MEKKLNAPFVALLATVVGMVIAGFVVAVDPLPGPPLKEVSTYTVTSGWVSVLGSGYINATARAACNPGDLVAGGGFQLRRFYLGISDDPTAYVLPIASRPYVDEASGGQGWEAIATATSSSNYVRAYAVCLHRA